MTPLTILLVALAVASSNGASLWNPCGKHDLSCIRASVEYFNANTREGKPELGLKPLDPFTYEGNTVSGFSNLKVTELSLDLDSLPAPAKISFKIDYAVESVEGGAYKSSASASATAEYTLSTKEVNGKTYFVVGPETIKCEVGETRFNRIDVPKFTDPLASLCEAGIALDFANVRALAEAYPADYFISDL